MSDSFKKVAFLEGRKHPYKKLMNRKRNAYIRHKRIQFEEFDTDDPISATPGAFKKYQSESVPFFADPIEDRYVQFNEQEVSQDWYDFRPAGENEERFIHKRYAK